MTERLAGKMILVTAGTFGIGEAVARRVVEDVTDRVYNIADDAPVTMVDLFQFHGLPVPQEAYDKDAQDPWHSVMSTTRIRRELGYRPLVPSVWTE
ncbi:hypothetical protein ACFQ1S_35710, partial [Kibdelosporangium lantanae]